MDYGLYIAIFTGATMLLAAGSWTVLKQIYSTLWALLLLVREIASIMAESSESEVELPF